ncbi:hypothetical protein MMC31_001739 [Peltigera leucophlebia]|nr:hypothetical protein [Peltigera leucophlebia]
MNSATEDRGPLFLQAIWIEAAIASLFVAARIFTRIKIQGKLSPDDYLLVLALLSGFMSGGLATRSVNWGFGKHIYYLSREQVSQAIKYQYMAQPFAYMALVFGRVSFAVSLLMIIATNKLRRWILYGLIIGQLLINIIFICLGLGQCSPPAKYWNPSIPGSCMSPRVIVAAGYVQGSWNIFTDFALALLPGVIISNLNMKISLKVGLVVLMSLGIFNMAAAIITVVEISRIGGTSDFTYEYIIADIWGIIQTYLAITVASIPFIKPLFRDSNVFNLKFYRSIIAKSSFRTHTSRHRSRFGTFKRGYTMQKDDRTCGSPAPLSPANESFIITALPSVKFDGSNRNNNLREAHEFSLA